MASVKAWIGVLRWVVVSLRAFLLRKTYLGGMLGHAIATSEGQREESSHRGHIYYTSFVAPFRLYERNEGPWHPPHPNSIDLVFFFFQEEWVLSKEWEKYLHNFLQRWFGCLKDRARRDKDARVIYKSKEGNPSSLFLQKFGYLLGQSFYTLGWTYITYSISSIPSIKLKRKGKRLSTMEGGYRILVASKVLF